LLINDQVLLNLIATLDFRNVISGPFVLTCTLEHPFIESFKI
jgi:hypothetical protein